MSGPTHHEPRPTPARERRPARPDGERIITDEVGRVWSVREIPGPDGDVALLFTCVSDARQRPRALDAELLAVSAAGARETTLLRLLHEAPYVGRLNY